VTNPSPNAAPDTDGLLAERLRAGDPAAFAELIRRYHARLLRLSLVYVKSKSVAEEVAQEAWIGVFRGIHRYEGRATLKSWIFGITVNCAKERALRESRSIPFSALEESMQEEAPEVDPRRFRGVDDPYPGGWRASERPRAWDDAIEARLYSREVRLLVLDAIALLPPAQRLVITLRDIDELPPAEVGAILGISEGNQRVLLHRARSKVRNILERHFDKEIR
jgi:RNA polymerase sigma-70 factor, ECF subfamily